MRSVAIVLVSCFSMLLPSLASASELEAACVAGKPDGTSDSEAEAFCSCLASEVDGNESIQAELIESWPANTPEGWVAGLSGEAAAAAQACF